jgi:hypothetical protein
VKIYVVAAVEALRKMMVSWVSPPPWMLMYFFAGFFFNLTLCMTKLRVLVLSFLTLRISLLCKGNIHKCKVKLMGVEHSQNKRLGRGGNLGGRSIIPNTMSCLDMIQPKKPYWNFLGHPCCWVNFSPQGKTI